MTYVEMPSEILFYKGCRYKGWYVETQPNEKRLFADIKLLYRFEEEDESDHSLEDRIAYYVSPSEDVEKAIDNFLDGECLKDLDQRYGQNLLGDLMARRVSPMAQAEM